jgi:hypothetical protein
MAGVESGRRVIVLTVRCIRLGRGRVLCGTTRSSPRACLAFPFCCQVNDAAVPENVHRRTRLAADLTRTPGCPPQGRARSEDVWVLRLVSLPYYHTGPSYPPTADRQLCNCSYRHQTVGG